MSAVIQGCFPRGLPRAGATRATPHAVQLSSGTPPLPRAGGRPLAPPVLQKMESLFGMRLHDVRVHVGPHVTALGAQALTHGNDIHFAPGHYNPTTLQGQQLLAQEIAHVVQQRSGRVRNPFGSGVAIVHDPRFQAEADLAGRHARQPAVVQPNWLIGGLTGVGAMAATGLASYLGAPIGLGYLGYLGVGAAGTAIGHWLSGSPPPNHPVPAAVVVPNQDLRNQPALFALQTAHGGSSEGTLAFFVLANGTSYIIEQETNNRVFDECRGRGITYIPQGRLSGFHAEMRFVKYAADNGILLAGAEVWVSKPICQDCADRLHLHGVTLRTVIDPHRYHSWVDPATLNVRTEVQRPVGQYRGHRPEAERLRSDMQGSKYWG